MNPVLQDRHQLRRAIANAVVLLVVLLLGVAVGTWNGTRVSDSRLAASELATRQQTCARDTAARTEGNRRARLRNEDNALISAWALGTATNESVPNRFRVEAARLAGKLSAPSRRSHKLPDFICSADGERIYTSPELVSR